MGHPETLTRCCSILLSGELQQACHCHDLLSASFEGTPDLLRAIESDVLVVSSAAGFLCYRLATCDKLGMLRRILPI